MGLSEWVAWAVAVIAGLGGLILGIRAELRATHYSTLWIVKPGAPVRFINRTGEDATNVKLSVTHGKHDGRTHFIHVERDRDIQAVIHPHDDGTFAFDLEWTRPANQRTYKYGESWIARRWRWLRHH